MTEVVLSYVPNPKRANAAKRYDLYYAGATAEDLITRGMTKGDITWDRKQSFVTWGEGERVEPPPLPLAALVTATPAARTPTTTRAVSPPPAEAGADEPASWKAGVSRVVPAATMDVVGSTSPEKLAAWYKTAVRVSARAESQDQTVTNACRPWRVQVELPDGRALVRIVPGDRLAAALVVNAATLGVDPDEWTKVEVAA